MGTTPKLKVDHVFDMAAFNYQLFQTLAYLNDLVANSLNDAGLDFDLKEIPDLVCREWFTYLGRRNLLGWDKAVMEFTHEGLLFRIKAK